MDDWGSDAAEPLVYEWRGALFRVRLARLRLAGPSQLASGTEPTAGRSLKAPLAAVALVLGGAALFVAGASTRLWPIWVAGMIAVCTLRAHVPEASRRGAEPRERLLAAEQLEALEQRRARPSSR